MPSRGSGFDDIETAHQGPAPGYDAIAIRRRVDLRWTDAAGAHTASVDGRVVLGAAEGAGIVVADPAASRIHAELDVRDDGVWLRDLGSRNGTFIDGVQLIHARVPDRAQIRLGSTVIAAERAGTGTPVELWPHDRLGPLLGRSRPMRELFARLARVAPTESTVLVQGETGTGKELVARAIHEASPRARGPLVVVDCAALPEGVIDAELFGHAKGAFTGAVAAREGAIAAADGGTVLLDEVGELPLAVQPKLLRVIESRTVRRVGETAHRTVDVRFLSATHRDLRTMVNEGAFREDLFFRLAVLPVTVPPLRDRAEDVAMLLEHFVPRGSPPMAPDVVAEAARRPWLGNVRELRNFVERAVAFGAREALAMAASPAATSPSASIAGAWGGLEVTFDRPLREAREAWIDAFEREYVRRLLARHDGNVQEAAATADVDRTYVYRLIRKHGL
jgi:transcriptional regulator with GAF, ATPase, and Fis domain